MDPQPAASIANTVKPTSLSLSSRIAWTLLISATLYVCYFSHLGAIGFVGPDEPRYAWIARAMAETGDWVTPRLYGRPWFEKPVLYYWEAAACFKIFGVSEAAARLPSAFSALLATLAMAWLAWRVYGAETARWFLLLLPTSAGMIGFSHAGATDMPFSGTLVIALVCSAVVLGLAPRPNQPVPNGAQHSFACCQADGAGPGQEQERPARLHENHSPNRWLALLFFGFSLGLAVLAKGPAAIVLMGGAVFFWALFSKRWRGAFRLVHPVALIAFCATALPWYILCARRNPDFFRVFIIEHNFKRFLTPEFQHIQPFWYYGVVLLVAFLPWTGPFVLAAISGIIRLGRTRCTSEINGLLLCWSVFCVLFFSVSKSKLPGYTLPAIAPLALLLSEPLVRRLPVRQSANRFFFLTVGLTLAALSYLSFRLADRIPFVTDVHPTPTAVRISAAFLIGALIVLVLAWLGRSQYVLLATALIPIAVLTLCAPTLWQLDAGISARRAINIARERLAPDQLDQATTYKLNRALKYQVQFYLHREVQEWSPDNRTHSMIFASGEGWRELPKLGPKCAHYSAYPAVMLCEDAQGEAPWLVSARDGGEVQ